ncbi:bifunctional phosphopantothenoylcysteine decarboxylase/phosphopantothenate--cysteine ligase CoaBC [Tahibacter amnicola]|uniref:Coenzyme A biosynthesis bifunctional protein CoaBC n=1 Tax=Tahibacter amnicola TaxID=2976241 RepID=A0ABY6BEP1_9GAMM|nr:bifunctional phosphopantothenoylcysteine decarboxylase/phosphopantothenate--cysteine ligase CoaBC [Tahibacter amnicola]UXI68252.1 bifunctional phosphopantothenoylcysteine decarboxylase/phosphopantothenate--cysteine ligase CoaBC [Tahibacter amnicola]
MDVSSLAQLRILLGVSGGIAAYKAADLVRRLVEAGAQVRVVMTESAARFVTPLTFQALSGHPVRQSLWDESAEAAMGHIELARWADQILIAPASADLIARLAQGQADDLLTTLCLASAAPLAIAPAMNQQMWAHAATQANVAVLRQRNVAVFGPASGAQACGEIGPGRLLEPTELVAELARHRAPGILTGVRVLVSAGPTFEDIDPVRFLGNRSSGRMGFAVAEAAARQGAQVTLVAGPVHLPTPAGVRRINVRSACEMHREVMAAAASADIFVAAAAVGDYRPVAVAEHKIKKQGDGGMTLCLTQNPDILAEVAALPRRPFLVGFAAETQDVEAHARLKLEKKRLDMIAANRVGGGLGFEADDNALTLIAADGAEHLPTASKRELARSLIERITARFNASRRDAA